jgi:hypothetical protein
MVETKDDVVGECQCGEPLFRWEEDPDVSGMYVCIYCGTALELYQ